MMISVHNPTSDAAGVLKTANIDFGDGATVALETLGYFGFCGSTGESVVLFALDDGFALSLACYEQNEVINYGADEHDRAWSDFRTARFMMWDRHSSCEQCKLRA